MTWDDVRAYITKNYKFEELEGGIIKMLWTLEGGRSQAILVSTSRDWLSFYSPAGNVPTSLLSKALQVANDWMGGGLVALDDEGMVWARTCTLLPSLSLEAFDRLMQTTMTMADEIEKRILGEDRF